MKSSFPCIPEECLPKGYSTLGSSAGPALSTAKLLPGTKNGAVRMTRRALQRGSSKLCKCFEKNTSALQGQAESSWQSIFPPKASPALSATTAQRMSAAPGTRFCCWRAKAKTWSSRPRQQVWNCWHRAALSRERGSSRLGLDLDLVECSQ